MKYIIHSNIEFDTTEYILTSLNDDKKSIKLSNSAGKILEELIKHQNTDTLVTREYLFTVVWKSHGLEASHGNLNQQISLIRKTLATFGLDSSCIITVPKRGLKLGHQITIKNVQDKNCIPNVTNVSSVINQNGKDILSNSILLNYKTYISYIITLIAMIIIVFSMSLMFFYSKIDNIKLYCCKEVNTCSICPIPATAEPENNDYNLPYFEVI